jgi:hypothetical protein
MASGLYWLSTFPAEPSYPRVLPALILMGAGVGATFPAVSIGSMGTIRGQELGLGSGIVNMSRQVGFAVGVALLVAVFTGSLSNELEQAERQVASNTACARGSPCFQTVFSASSNPTAKPAPKSPVERRAHGILQEHVRDAYGAALRVAALVTLFAIPFSLTMRRRPGEAPGASQHAVATAH